MPTDIRIIYAHDFIRATPGGEIDFETTKKILIEIASASTKLADYEIFIDSRKAQSLMSVTDLWHLAAEFSNLRKPFSLKTAVLCPVERFDSVAFFTLCAANRGLRVKGFTSFEDAIGWLMENGTLRLTNGCRRRASLRSHLNRPVGVTGIDHYEKQAFTSF